MKLMVNSTYPKSLPPQTPPDRSKPYFPHSMHLLVHLVRRNPFSPRSGWTLEVARFWESRVNKRWVTVAITGLVCLGLAFADGYIVWATTSSSTNYEITEAEFGAGATLDSCSGQYCAQATIGSLSGDDGVSPSGSTASFTPLATDSQPSLEVIVERGESNLGVLATDKTASTAMVVRVRSYLSNGYVVQIAGDPPTYRQHALATPITPVASTPGIEQFGINAVKNTTPAIGADIDYIAGEGLSFGEILANYGTANKFMYQSGADVAISRSESAETKYTISMVVNVAGSTPAGHYSTDLSAVVVPFF